MPTGISLPDSKFHSVTSHALSQILILLLYLVEAGALPALFSRMDIYGLTRSCHLQVKQNVIVVTSHNLTDRYGSAPLAHPFPA